MNRREFLFTNIAAITAFSTTVNSQTNSINGAGATFPAPLYHSWAENIKQHVDFNVNYQSIGSGAGINQIINRTVDFGATDAPLSVERLTQNNLMQVPTVMGSLVISYNIPGITSGQLRLTPETLVAIYMGQITMWNDPRLVSVNPGVTLPRLAIVPMYRADGSGTTWVFTQYLSKVSDSWKNSVGSGTSVRWPVGQGARGNEGVSATVSRVRGSIGYIESSYSILNNIPTASLQNKNGKFITATKQSVQNAASSAVFEESNGFVPDLLNQSGDDVWPIVAATYLLIPTNSTDRIKTQNVIRFIEWCFNNGDQMAERLHYVPLPTEVKTKLVSSLRQRIR